MLNALMHYEPASRKKSSVGTAKAAPWLTCGGMEKKTTQSKRQAKPVGMYNGFAG
jgi:hypothetical protein